MPLHAEAECAPTSTAFVTLRQLSVTWRGSRVSQVSHGHGLVESGCEMRSSTMYVIYGVNYGYIIRITNVIYDIWYIIYIYIWLYGSIPIFLPFLMGWTSIYQLFWCELQGYKVLTHCHIILQMLYITYDIYIYVLATYGWGLNLVDWLWNEYLDVLGDWGAMN